MQDNNTNPFDFGDDKSTPDLDIGTPQDQAGELDIAFVDDEPEGQQPEAQARRGQNEPEGQDDPGDAGHDDREAQWQQEREQSIAREEQLARQAIEVEARRVATERESAKVALEAVDSKISMITEALKAAKAEGDTSAEVDFAQALTDARTLRSNIVQAANQLATEEQIRAAGQQWIAENISARRQQQVRQAPVVPSNDLAAKYIQHNAWMTSNAQARNYAMAASQMLAAEGIDPKSPQHFVELSRRVAQKFPSLGVRSADGRAVGTASATPSGQSRPQTPPVASARGTSGTSPAGQQASARRGTVSITPRDQAIMRKMGLDPSKKEVQQYYAKEKLARLSSESRR